MCIRDRICDTKKLSVEYNKNQKEMLSDDFWKSIKEQTDICLLYTSDAADERSSVDLGGRRIIKKKYTTQLR